jgi:hypothetical protein
VLLRVVSEGDGGLLGGMLARDVQLARDGVGRSVVGAGVSRIRPAAGLQLLCRQRFGGGLKR